MKKILVMQSTSCIYITHINALFEACPIQKVSNINMTTVNATFLNTFKSRTFSLGDLYPIFFILIVFRPVHTTLVTRYQSMP